MYYLVLVAVLLVPMSTLENICSVSYNKETQITKRQCTIRHSRYSGYQYVDKNGVTKICYNDNGNYYYDDSQEFVSNSTITCSSLYSSLDISYRYREEEYEQFLKIVSSNISTLEPSAFLSFTIITKLYLSEIHIKSVKPGAFNGLSNLKELYLDKNNISEIHNRVFHNLYKLQILNLGNNKILNIDKSAFMGLTNLSTLFLNNNKLTIIEKQLFETQEHLKYLDLSNNPFTILSTEGLPKLDTLILSGSLLGDFKNVSNFTKKFFDLASSKLTTVDFSFAPKTDELDMSKNEIVSIENCELLNVLIVNLNYNNISLVNGTFNGLSEIYLSHNQLELLDSALLTESKNLSVVDFSFNKIKYVDENLFKELYFLIDIHLQNNEIAKINVGLFQDLTSLKLLDLSNNKIESFQYGTFDSLTSLETLDISGNNLVDLNQYIFHSLSMLINLKFSGNRISSFDAYNLGKYHKNLRLVSLNDNPWSCKNLINIKNVFKLFHISIAVGTSFDVENVHGNACSNQKDVDSVNVTQDVSKLFSNEKFALNFQKEIDKRVLMTSTDSNRVSSIQIFNSIILFVIMATVIFIAYFIVFKKTKFQETRRPSEIEIELP